MSTTTKHPTFVTWHDPSYPMPSEAELEARHTLRVPSPPNVPSSNTPALRSPSSSTGLLGKERSKLLMMLIEADLKKMCGSSDPSSQRTARESSVGAQSMSSRCESWAGGEGSSDESQEAVGAGSDTTVSSRVSLMAEAAECTRGDRTLKRKAPFRSLASNVLVDRAESLSARSCEWYAQ